MKIKFGALMVDGRGKIGGHVASKNRGGAYLRTKVTPVNPQTAAQSNVRGLFTSISQAWRTLTESARTAWNNAVSNFAKTDVFGDIKNPSGSNLYLKLNQNLALIGQPAITTPPEVASSPEFIEFTPTVNGTTPALSIALGTSPVPAHTYLVVEATSPQSAGKSFLKNKFRVIGVIAPAATSPSNQLANYTAKFGALVPGQKVGIRIKAVNGLNGIAGQYNSQTVIAS